MPPPTGTSHRDEAVRLLTKTIIQILRQDSLDSLHPEFQAQIAACVDEIIAAAKPGGGPPPHQAQAQTEAKASPPHHSALSGIEHAVEGAVHAIEHAVEDLAQGQGPKPPGERRQGERRGKG